MQLINEHKDVVDKILASKYFVSSPTSKALLKYLVQATSDNLDIKESVIGMHILGNRYDGEKSNARIRVSVFHLRKRLQQYYDEEGLDDPIKLVIDKGQYRVSFVEDNHHQQGIRIKMNIHVLYAFLFVGILFVYWATHHRSAMPVWNQLLNNNKETVLYIGDVYGYFGKTTTGGWGWQRDYLINSEEAFMERKNLLNLPDSIVQAANYSHVTVSEVDAVKSISHLFYRYDRDFSVRLASKVNVKDIKELNIIYAGPIKTNNRFIPLLIGSNSHFTYHNDELFITNSNGVRETLAEKYRNFLRENVPSEIAVVAHLKGTQDTQQFLFFSDHDMGVRATVDFFVNKKSLAQFQNEHLEGIENFIAVFLVNGNERIDLGIKLLDVYEVNTL